MTKPEELQKELLNGIDVGVDNGNLITTSGSVVTGGFGADGGHLIKFEIDGDEYGYNKATGKFIKPDGTETDENVSVIDKYEFNAVDNSVAVHTNKGGIFHIDFDDASYKYTGSKTVLNDYQEVITYSTKDNDGDELLDAVLTLDVYRFEARNDIILTNQAGNTIEIDQATLMANDDTHGGAIVSGVGNPENASVSGTDPVQFTFGTDASKNSTFEYTLSEYGRSDSATVIVKQTTGANITGTSERETIIGNEDDNIIRAYGGDDIASGEAGNDKVYGYNGDDVLYGGDGHDYVYGGSGNDYIDTGSSANPSSGAANSSFNGDRAIGGTGNDTIVYGADDKLIWGEGGKDTLKITDEVTVDLTTMTHQTSNGANIGGGNFLNAGTQGIFDMEVFDLTDSKAQTIKLGTNDVLDVTDGNNTLFIDGGAEDTIDQTGFTQQATSDQAGYTMYTGNGATLYIDTDINNVI